ncbi:hypothetical protein CK203_037048 [Vitis vinifera]|uniref:Uncharacterized protein n=1 Tax=Vitis vinifera TaxID=29760 RepID=A0A438I5W8_VITVI|nr:hypothetical protein CK203_037048 [Vitis vinifera]
MPITTMENTETELGIGGDLPMLNHQHKLRVYSRKAKHQAPQKVLVVTLQEHYQETELETNPKSEGVSGCEGVLGFPGNQQEDMLQQQNDLDLDLDMPIAVRKEVPNSIHEALKIPEWKATVMEEMQALKKNDTWDIVELPKGK